MAWLGTWKHRIEIIVDADKFDNHASEFTARVFPYNICIGSSVGQSSQDLTAIFDELGSESLKIAITEDDGTTECYYEVERWDDSGEKGLIWFGSDDANYSASDYSFYIYFDSSESDNTSYGGVPGSTNGGLVWHDYYKFVCHMASASGALIDSSGNGNDTGTKVGSGSVTYRQDDATGCGYSMEWGTGAAYYYKSTVGINYGGSGPVDWCNMAHINCDDVNVDQYYLLGDPSYGWYMRVDDSSGGKVLYKIDDGVDDDYGYSTTGVYGSWHTTSQTLDYSVAIHEGFIDGVEEYQGVVADVNAVGDLHDTIEIGCYNGGSSAFDGHMAEVRLSYTAWNDRWQVAEHETLMDNTNTYGTQETLITFKPRIIII